MSGLICPEGLARHEVWPIDRLTANPRNARIRGPERIEQIRASLREFGWTMPVLVRENGMLIAGHGRLEAAKLEGITEAPTIVARGWTEAQCQAYANGRNGAPPPAPDPRESAKNAPA